MLESLFSSVRRFWMISGKSCLEKNPLPNLQQVSNESACSHRDPGGLLTAMIDHRAMPPATLARTRVRPLPSAEGRGFLFLEQTKRRPYCLPVACLPAGRLTRLPEAVWP